MSQQNITSAKESLPSVEVVQKNFTRNFHDKLRQYPGIEVAVSHGVVRVYTARMATHGELGLPGEFMGYSVEVCYEHLRRSLDPTEESRFVDGLKAFPAGVALPQGLEEDLKEVDRVIRGLILPNPKGYLFSYPKLHNKKAIIIVAIQDWRLSDHLKHQLPHQTFRGTPIKVIRIEVVSAASTRPFGEYYQRVMLPGSFYGNMSMGPVFKKEGDNENVYVLQCRHGYQHIDQNIYTPEGGFILQECMDELAQILVYTTDPAERAWFAEAKKQCEDVLSTIPIDELHHIYRVSDARLSPFRVGKTKHFIGDLDACWVKVKIPPTSERRLSKIPNQLRAPHIIARKNLPERLTGTWVGTDTALKATFDTATEVLYKYGIKTGHTQFVVNPGYVYKGEIHGFKKAIGVVPVSGQIFGNIDKVIDKGDSSGPVFTKEGQLVGIVTGFVRGEEIGMFTSWHEINRQSVEEGWSMRLV
jgi:hypothetical protein